MKGYRPLEFAVLEDEPIEPCAECEQLRAAARDVLDLAYGVTFPTELTLALHRLSRLARLAEQNERSRREA